MQLKSQLDYNVNRLVDSIAVIDTKTHSIVATIQVGDGPQDVKSTPDGKLAYVVNQGDDVISGSVTVIDVKTHSIVATISIASPDESPVNMTE